MRMHSVAILPPSKCAIQMHVSAVQDGDYMMDALPAMDVICDVLLHKYRTPI